MYKKILLGIFAFSFLCLATPAEAQKKISPRKSKVVKAVQKPGKKVQRQQSSSRAKQRTHRKNRQRQWTVARFNKLPAKEKIHLYRTVVSTMAVLEISRSRRKQASSQHLWQLLLPFAYAAGNGCFFGGHFAENCRATQEVYNNNACDIGDRKGVRCDARIFSTSPCVHQHNREINGSRVRGYASTQACAYAEAQRIKQYLETTNASDVSIESIKAWGEANPDSSQIANELMSNRDFWVPVTPDNWKEETDAMLAGIPSDKQRAYEQALITDSAGVIARLREVQSECSGGVRPFEQKHCDFFQRELDRLSSIDQTPQPDPAPPDPETPTTTTTTSTTTTTVSEPRTPEVACKSFAQLPGEHFCQLKFPNGNVRVVRLEERENIHQAVIYDLNKNNGQYCLNKDYSSVNQNNSNSNLKQPDKVGCISDSESNEASFQLSNTKINIKKFNGRSNRCLLTTQNGNIMRTENFIPGIDINDEDFNTEKLNEKLEALSNRDQDKDKCFEPDVVALQEASLVLENHKECIEKRVRVQRRERGNTLNTTQQFWRETEFSSNKVLSLMLQYRANAQYGKYHFRQPSLPPRGAKIGNNAGCGRKNRTVTDWFYGDCADLSNPIASANTTQSKHPGFASNPVCIDYETDDFVGPRQRTLNRTRSSGETD